MTKGLTRHLRFLPMMWLLVIFAGLWITGGPLVQNLWAKTMWRQVRCWVAGQRFFYEIDGQRYVCNRTDFWVSLYHTDPVEPAPISVEGQPNTTCWVSPRDPRSAVLRLDPPPTLSEGANRYATAALLLAGAAIVTFAGRRRATRPKPPLSPGSP